MQSQPGLPQPLERPASMVDCCAARLKRSILSGELAVGSRLPPERVLAAELGVNRTTLRAALREVANAGLLTARQGSGHAVRDFAAVGGPDLVPTLVELARDTADLGAVAEDLLLVRRHLAIGLIERLAGVPRSAAALAEVSGAIDAFEGSALAMAPLRELCLLDVAVVRALAALTGSRVLALFINPIEAILLRVPELASAMYADPAENVAAYRALVATLAAGLDATPFVRDALLARDTATLARLRAALDGEGA